MEIIKDQENCEKALKQNSTACMEKLQRQLKDHVLLIHSMQDDIKKYRQTVRKLQLDKEVKFLTQTHKLYDTEVDCFGTNCFEICSSPKNPSLPGRQQAVCYVRNYPNRTLR